MNLNRLAPYRRITRQILWWSVDDMWTRITLDFSPWMVKS